MTLPLLTPAPVTVHVGPLRVTVPPMTAAGWLACIGGRPVEDVIPGSLSPEDRADVAIAMVQGLVTARDVERAAREAMAAASGRTWWETMRIAGGSLHPTVFGELTLRGVDAERVTLAAWCAAVFALAVRGKDDKERGKFEFDLMRPPPGEKPPPGSGAIVW